MTKLIYENVNLQTHFSYSVYSYSGAYFVRECDQDGHAVSVEKFNSRDDAVTFARKKCR